MDALKFGHVVSFALEHPWAVTPTMASQIADVLARHLGGQDADPAVISAALVNRKNLPQPRKGGAVAVLPVYGVIAPRMNMLSDVSGGTTFEALTGQLHEAMANPDVSTIVFDVDSPGGNVAGASEFAREVLKARTTKPIIAVANHLMASAAYWPMACCTEVVATPSAMVGSIGVFTIHDDVSASLEKLGIKRTVIGAGKYKTEGIGGTSLSDDAAAHMQSLVEAAYERFIGDVAKGRGVTAAAVRSGYGQGRCLNVEAALAAGMVDRIATLNDTLARVVASPPRASPASATATVPAIAATQEPPPDAAWQNTIERALLELDL